MDNSNSQNTTIMIASSLMKFAAGHFTIFSEHHRETIHGHNFKVECLIGASIERNDMAFDYGVFKKAFVLLCASLDEKLLLPAHSLYLTIKQNQSNVHCFYGDEEMLFPKRDVVILPLENITIEAMAKWFLEQIKIKTHLLNEYPIDSLEISVLSSPSQRGSIKWIRNI